MAERQTLEPSVHVDEQSSPTPRMRIRRPRLGKRSFAGYYSSLLRTSLPLVFGDLLAIYSGILLGWISNRVLFGVNILGHDGLFTLMPFAVLAHLTLTGCYPLCGVNPAFEFRKVALSVIQAFALIATFCLAHYSSPFVAFSVLLTVGIPIAFGLPCNRQLLRRMLSKYSWWPMRVAFVGLSSDMEKIYGRMASRPSQGYQPAGYFGSSAEQWRSPALAWLGDFDDIEQVIHEGGIFAAVIDGETSGFASDALLRLVPNLYIVNPQSSHRSLWVSLSELAGVPSQLVVARLDMACHHSAKRAMDVLLSGLALILLGPLLFGIALMVRMSSSGPVLYRQRRIGKSGKHFYAWKFRSMVENAEEVLRQKLSHDEDLRREWENDHKLRADPRVTPIGAFLRRTSLDELPQLWNILVGDMSLVGPRPIPVYEENDYEQAATGALGLYSRVTPGLTGLWQVSGRNLTTYQQRVRLDSYYVQNWSLWLDAYIIFRTLKTVLMREGAY